MKTLPEYKDQIASWLNDDFSFTCAILLLVAVAAFGLGRWSVGVPIAHERPVLVPTPVAVDAIAAATPPAPDAPASPDPSAALGGNFVASVNGTKYHALTCPGAKQISEQNKIYFQTTQEAQAAGYQPAANCSF